MSKVTLGSVGAAKANDKEFMQNFIKNRAARLNINLDDPNVSVVAEQNDSVITLSAETKSDTEVRIEYRKANS